MNKPEPSIPEEMLSAYLDGELSADERQQVDTALEKNEQMRNLLAELEQIRGEIQQLPRHTLSNDFAARVAQATQLTNDAVTTVPGSRDERVERVDRQVDAKHVGAGSTGTNNSRVRWIVGVAASAAAILFAFFVINPGSAPMTSDLAMTNNQKATSRSELDRLDKGLMAPSGAPALDALDEQVMEDGPGMGGGMGGMGGGMGGSIAGFGNDSVAADAAYALDSVADASIEEADIAFQSDTQSFAFQERQAAYDAVVYTSVTGDKLAQVIAASKDPASKSFGLEVVQQKLAMQSKAQPTRAKANALVKESMQRSLAEGLPDNALVMVIEGTREEIERRFSELNVPLSNVQLLAQHTSANALGIPPLDSLAATQSQSPFGFAQEERMLRRSVARSVQPSVEAMSAAPSLPAAVASAAPAPNELKKSDVRENIESLAEPAKAKAKSLSDVKSELKFDAAPNAPAARFDDQSKLAESKQQQALGGRGARNDSEESPQAKAEHAEEESVAAKGFPKYRILFVVQPE